MMKSLIFALLAAGSCIGAFASEKPSKVSDTALLFGAAADTNCEETSFQNESGFVAAWAAKFAVNAVVGLASSMLDKATEKPTQIHLANAPGHFFSWDGGQSSWVPREQCIRFWYGRQQAVEISGDDDTLLLRRYGEPPKDSERKWKDIAARWAQLGLVDQPYVYGEIRIHGHATDNALVLQPLVLFARPLPGAAGFFRETKKLSVALDLKLLGATNVLATHSIEFPEVADGATLVRGESAKGLASAWAALPAKPTFAPKGTETASTPFSALVTFTNTTDGTLFGKTLASTFAAQKSDLILALSPKTNAEKDAAEQKAMSNAFDAIADVDDAKKALDTSTVEADKPKLLTLFKKAQYLANMKLLAAGLPARFDVAAP
jgi:hypothetical protein